MSTYPITVEVWRMVAGASRTTLTRVAKSLPARIVPVTRTDAKPGYARESTHVVIFPPWVEPDTDVCVEDELRTGRLVYRGAIQQRRYKVDGVRRYDVGLAHTETFVQERR